MKRPAVLMMVASLAGCNVHSKHSSDSDDNVAINAEENGSVSFDMPFVKGQVKLPSGFMHNGDVDIDGVKLMPGSKVTGVNVDSHNDVSNVEMSFTAPAAPDQVRAYFVEQFKSHGGEAAVSGDAVTGKSKDGSPFTIDVTPAGSGSQGRVRLQDKG